jgi:hypothetical protein
MVNNLINSYRNRQFDYTSYKNEIKYSSKYDKNFDVLRDNTLINKGPVFSYFKINPSRNTVPYSLENPEYIEERIEPLTYYRFIR